MVAVPNLDLCQRAQRRAKKRAVKEKTAGGVAMEGVVAETPRDDSDGHGFLHARASANSSWYPSSAGGLQCSGTSTHA
eukprot:2077028-Karenia_brevis.AAC.1